MKRYLLISLGIGLLVAVVILALYFMGIYEPLVAWLNSFYINQGFFPADAKVERLVWAEVAVIVVAAIWTTWCLCDLSQGAQKVIVLFTFFLVILAISPVLSLFGILFEPFSALSALIFAGSAAIVFSSTELGTRKRTLETVLGGRVSRNTFNALMASPKKPSFDSSKKEVSVLTCRVFNRAELSEKLSPGDFLKMTNLFRRVISNYLLSQGAYLDEAGPELVRGYFGLLQDDNEHAVKACRAALDLRACIKTINQECHARWFQELQAGVGVSSGDVISGIYGSKEHFFLSGIGPEVDFSRRLSKANLLYGSDLLVGPATFNLVQETMEMRPMEMFYDPETKSMTEIYQLLSAKEDLSEANRKLRDLYWEGVIHYREGNYTKAIESFGKARIPGREDGPLEYFILAAQETLAGTRPPNDEKSGLTVDGHSRLLRNL